MESSSIKQTVSDDPFAEDIFATASIPPIEKSEPPIAEETILWFRQLSKVDSPQNIWDELLLKLPPVFAEKLPEGLANALSELLYFQNEKKIKFIHLLKCEIESIKNLDSVDSHWLTLGIEESKTEFSLEITDDLIAWLIAAALGGLGETDKLFAGTNTARKFTASELAVVEYICLNLTTEANRVLESPVFRFRRLSRTVPEWLTKKSEDNDSNIMTASWQVMKENLPGIVKIYFAPELLKALQPDENNLLDGNFGKVSDALKNKIKYLKMRLPFGSVELSVDELSALETGDVFLPQGQKFFLKNGNLAGETEVIFGDGDAAAFSGEFSGANFEMPVFFDETAQANQQFLIRRLIFKNPLNIKIKEFADSESLRIIKNTMTESNTNPANEASEDNIKEEGQPDLESAEAKEAEESVAEAAGLAVENLIVSLRVELSGRRLSLAEVGNLRENQILELGIRPTDEVNLLIENQTIGRGELVAVEDRLGVRVTKLLQ